MGFLKGEYFEPGFEKLNVVGRKKMSFYTEGLVYTEVLSEKGSEVNLMSVCFPLECNPREARVRHKERLKINLKIMSGRFSYRTFKWLLSYAEHLQRVICIMNSHHLRKGGEMGQQSITDAFLPPVSHLWYARVLTFPSSHQRAVVVSAIIGVMEVISESGFFSRGFAVRLR